jgi:hypothetical protein
LLDECACDDPDADPCPDRPPEAALEWAKALLCEFFARHMPEMME